jgi:hypothetical protein
MLFYTETEKTRIITGCDIPMNIVKEITNKCFIGYSAQWKESMWDYLKEIHCNEIFATRILSGQYDHNKALLKRHAELFNQDHLVEKIWQKIK